MKTNPWQLSPGHRVVERDNQLPPISYFQMNPPLTRILRDVRGQIDIMANNTQTRYKSRPAEQAPREEEEEEEED